MLAIMSESESELREQIKAIELRHAAIFGIKNQGSNKSRPAHTPQEKLDCRTWSMLISRLTELIIKPTGMTGATHYNKGGFI